MVDPRRYDNVPISEHTRKGMSLNIDDIAAIGRLLILQDDAYDERFDDLSKEIRKLSSEIAELKGQIKEITKTVDITRKEVDRLNRLNSWWAIGLRGLVWVGMGLGIIRLLHGKF
jgi:hypothetical protein